MGIEETSMKIAVLSGKGGTGKTAGLMQFQYQQKKTIK